MGIGEVFSRSWQITKLSFSVIGKDKEMLLFPILSGFFSLIFLIAMIFPTIIVSVLDTGSFNSGMLEYIIIFLVYLGLAFIATFFNVCTVYTVKTRFEGGDAKFGQSIGFAFSKIHLIFMWSLVAAIVGLLLRILEQLAQRMKGGGAIVLQVIRGLLGAAWGIITIFVVPGLVYKGLGPFAAIKESALTLKKTWGESLVRHFGLGIIQIVVFVLEFILIVLLFVILASFGATGMLIAIGIGVLVFLFTFLIFSLANTVYNTALYVYAQTGQIPDGFNSEVLRNAFENENKN